MERVSQIATVQLLAFCQFHEHLVLLPDDMFSLAQNPHHLDIMETYRYIGSHLCKKTLLLIIYCNIRCEQYGKQPEEPACMFHTEECSRPSATHVFEETVFTLS